MVVAEQPWPHQQLQILALDGGGLKGLFAAAVLADWERDRGISVRDHFDLIVGTSTGGLVALGLGAGMTPDEIVDFYVRKGRDIFPRSLLSGARKWWKAKHRSDPLKAALQEILGDRLLGHSKSRLVIPSYSLDEDEVYLFKTPHHPELRRDWRESMVDVGLATSAAPTYLPAARLRQHRLVDGGVWANNPCLIGVAEAVSVLGTSLAKIRVLSVGTTDAITSHPSTLNNAGLLRWAKPASRLVLRAQALGAWHTTEHLIGPDRVTRIDPKVPDGLFELDRLDADLIRGLADGVSRRRGVELGAFTAHRAAAYEPSVPVS
jgi:patatin-like phospholipase/acyl hydrolase